MSVKKDGLLIKYLTLKHQWLSVRPMDYALYSIFLGKETL